MKTFFSLCMLLLAMGSVKKSHCGNQDATPLQTVAHVDLNRYIGTWYEIAKIPNSFQRQCQCGTTAQYALLPDGRIEIINACVKKDDSISRAAGIARVVDANSNAKLKISFVSLLGIRLFWGDYWIIGLDENYQWAIVGTPGRKYGWILGRAPILNESTLKKIYEQLDTLGYNPEDFKPSTPCAQKPE